MRTARFSSLSLKTDRLCLHACSVIFAALSATLDVLYHITHTTNLITASSRLVPTLLHPLLVILEPWSWERPSGSQKHSVALISVTREGLTLHHVWVRPRFEGWSWTGARGAGGFQASHSAGLIAVPTRCSLQ